jgi:hypothetical protein
MAAEAKAKKRVQLDLTDSSMKRLSDLKETTESASYTEVVKNALRLYEDVINEARAGKTFFLRSPEGNEVEYRIFG